MKTIKKILKPITKHPIWTVIILCFILCFIDGYKTNQFNILGYFFLALFLLAAISPYIRKLRKQKAEKENAEYLAKKIAEQMNNNQQ